MSEVQALLRHYVEVRNRLQRPPNAVPDTGINLRIKRPSSSVLELTETPEDKSGLTPAQRKRLETYRDSFCRKGVTFNSVLRIAAKAFGVEYHLLIKRSRNATIVLPRQVAFYLANKYLQQSLSSMGRALGMDHTSVMHGRDKIKRIMATNPSFRDQIKAIEATLFENYPELAIPAIDKRPVEIKPGSCSQIRDLLEMDTSGGSAFSDPEERADQDVAGSIRNATTAIQRAS